MKSKHLLVAVLALCLPLNAQNTMNSTILTPEQQSFVALASYEAIGDQVSLREAINTAFDNGLTLNQIKEVFSHLYAYTGFPRSLNALNTLQAVVNERAEAGRPVVEGPDASPLPADYNSLEAGTKVQTELCGPVHVAFSPANDYYLKAHLFGDIFARDVLTYQQRELVTVSALAAMQGTEPQLNSHKRIAQTSGWSSEVVEAAAALAKHYTAATLTREQLHFPVGNPNDAYAQYFIGNSYVANLVGGDHAVNNVTFEPGCRNNWHIHHDAIQVLICVGGEGWYQEWGKPAQRLTAGDVVSVPVGVKHWHGAARDSWFQHLTLHVDATPLPGDTKTGNEWLEPVTDEVYNAL